MSDGGGGGRVYTILNQISPEGFFPNHQFVNTQLVLPFSEIIFKVACNHGKTTQVAKTTKPTQSE